MPELEKMIDRRVERYATGLVWAALAAALSAAIVAHDAPSRQALGLAIGLLLGVAACRRFPLHIAPKVKIVVASAPALCAALVLPPAMAILVTGVGMLTGELTSRAPGVQARLNAAVIALAVAPAALLGAAGRGPDSALSPLPAALLAAGALYLVNTVLVDVAVWLQVGRDPWTDWWERHISELPYEAALSLFAILAASIVVDHPAALAGLAGVCVLVYWALRATPWCVPPTARGAAAARRSSPRLEALLRHLSLGVPVALAACLVAGLHGVPLPRALLGGVDLVLAAGSVGTAVWTYHRLRSVPGLDEASRLALTDDLTGLLNRRALYATLQPSLDRAADLGREVAVVLWDLNALKGVNDTLGHAAGDESLKRFAAALQGLLVDGEIAARWGGDEFVALLPSGDSPAERARELVRALAATGAPPAAAGAGVFPADGSLPDDLIAAADNRMYAEKRRWRGATGWRPAPAVRSVRVD